MVKQNGHLVAAVALFIFACTAGALTPFGLSTIHVDAISLSHEPVSMLMLAMGLAAFLSRRLAVARVQK